MSGVLDFHLLRPRSTQFLASIARWAFSWLLRPVVQLARFPTALYPGWLRLLLTWVVPVGVLSTVPAQVLPAQILLDQVSLPLLSAVSVLAAAGLIATSMVFRAGLRRYASASS